MKKHLATRASQAGLSMVELMVSITIGLMITAGLATLFANASLTQTELRRTAQQIENGRYAMETLIQDLQLAGFFGENRNTPAPASLPDPCSFTTADLTAALGVPVQGYNSGSITVQASPPGTCSTWLPSGNLKAGSDILVVRRAETETVPPVPGTVTVAGTKYVQTSPTAIEVQDGGGTTSCTSKADGTAAAITRRCLFPTTVDVCATPCGAGTSPAGFVRKLQVHVYFVSPCNVPSSGTTCAGGDDNGRPIPTLKRLELTSVGGATTFQIVPIAEGVEFMQVAYGIDDAPAAVNPDTGRVGDGVPDRYVLTPSLAEFSNAVTVRVDLLVRNPEPSANFTDVKTYSLSVDPAAPTNPGLIIRPADIDTSYRRHAYAAEVRLVNVAGRKEIP
jgi:type IV pilus assembly protein PilW